MKNVLLRDEVYELLKNLKKKDESFADVINRLYLESRGRKASELLRKLMETKPNKEDLKTAALMKKRFRARFYDFR